MFVNILKIEIALRLEGIQVERGKSAMIFPSQDTDWLGKLLVWDCACLATRILSD